MWGGAEAEDGAELALTFPEDKALAQAKNPAPSPLALVLAWPQHCTRPAPTR